MYARHGDGVSRRRDVKITTCCSDFEAAHFSGSVPTAFNETLLREQAEHHGGTHCGPCCVECSEHSVTFLDRQAYAMSKAASSCLKVVMLRAVAIHSHPLPSILHQSKDIKSASRFKTIIVFSLVGVSVCRGGSNLANLGSYNLTSSGVGVYRYYQCQYQCKCLVVAGVMVCWLVHSLGD